MAEPNATLAAKGSLKPEPFSMGEKLIIYVAMSQLAKHKWGTNKSLQHLFPAPFVCVTSACGTAYSGDNGLNLKSKRKKCKVCEKLELQKEKSAP